MATHFDISRRFIFKSPRAKDDDIRDFLKHSSHIDKFHLVSWILARRRHACVIIDALRSFCIYCLSILKIQWTQWFKLTQSIRKNQSHFEIFIKISSMFFFLNLFTYLAKTWTKLIGTARRNTTQFFMYIVNCVHKLCPAQNFLVNLCNIMCKLFWSNFHESHRKNCWINEKIKATSSQLICIHKYIRGNILSCLTIVDKSMTRNISCWYELSSRKFVFSCVGTVKLFCVRRKNVISYDLNHEMLFCS